MGDRAGGWRRGTGREHREGTQGGGTRRKPCTFSVFLLCIRLLFANRKRASPETFDSQGSHCSRSPLSTTNFLPGRVSYYMLTVQSESVSLRKPQSRLLIPLVLPSLHSSVSRPPQPPSKHQSYYHRGGWDWNQIKSPALSLERFPGCLSPTPSLRPLDTEGKAGLS